MKEEGIRLSGEQTMRSCIALAAALALPVTSRASAQCAPSVQRLISDQKFDEARAEVQARLKIDDSDDAALHCMGMIYVSSNRASDAVEWFERAVKANDKSSAHHLWLGNALGEQASHTSKFKLPFLARRVKGEFDKAVQLDPASVDARHGLIQFYSQAPAVMGGSMDKAKEQAREILKLNPMRGHLETGALLEREKDIAGAEHEYSAALTSAPDSNVAYNALGGFYRGQKRYADAVRVYDRLLEVKPDARNAHLFIAWNLRLSGENVDRAEREIKFWLSQPPPNAPKQNLSFGHALLGDIYARQSKNDDARMEYQAALQLNPNNSDAKKGIEALK
jgi:tetratricopeptide (TPR) repeat protein